MRSFISSSEARFVAVLVLTFAVLTGAWESVLRRRAGATVDLAINRAEPATAKKHDDAEWVLFGNCLVMTGVSPRQLEGELPPDPRRSIVNIALHEQSPIAFFDYLKSTGHYPALVVTNVSSWLNGTNFEQEGELVLEADPLRLRPAKAAAGAGDAEKASTLQNRAETRLARWSGQNVKTLEHRYHLFDYAMFLGKLGTTWNLDEALYELNMQSWFKVVASEGDGEGYVGLRVAYREDWPAGLELMAERSLKRMRLSRLLTERYWSLLEANVREFKARGTEVLFVRMPEHPRIREWNDATYAIPDHLAALEARTGAATLDLSRLGPADGVRLFDAVHPDADAARVITQRVAAWLRARRPGLEVRP